MSGETEKEQSSGRSSPETDEQVAISDVPDDRIVEKAEADSIRTREKARATLAIVLALVLAGTLALAFTKVGTSSWQQAKDWLLIALPIESGALGSAIAWYYATAPR